MNAIQKQMIAEARTKYKDIYPCGNKKRFIDCFEFRDKELYFWFNCADKTTRLIKRGLQQAP